MNRSRRVWESCKEHKIWLLLLAFTDIIFSVFLWLQNAESFWILSGLLCFFTLCLFLGAICYMVKREVKREEAVATFLEEPDRKHEELLRQYVSGRECRQLMETGKLLRERERILQEQRMELSDYESYIESWAHEIKTPLSLMTLVLDNRKEEMSAPVQKRMEYAGNQMQGYVNQMLYYARLKAVHKDYLFEKVSLEECWEEVLAAFQMLLSEKGIRITWEQLQWEVVTDRKSFLFVLSQVLSNAVKYAKPKEESPTISLTAKSMCEKNCIRFQIKDNGVGVKAYDLPFLFEKGFTGEQEGQKQKSTGIGLYLVGKMAEELNIRTGVESVYGEGFEIWFEFPIV